MVWSFLFETLELYVVWRWAIFALVGISVIWLFSIPASLSEAFQGLSTSSLYQAEGKMILQWFIAPLAVITYKSLNVGEQKSSVIVIF